MKLGPVLGAGGLALIVGLGALVACQGDASSIDPTTADGETIVDGPTPPKPAGADDTEASSGTETPPTRVPKVDADPPDVVVDLSTGTETVRNAGTGTTSTTTGGDSTSSSGAGGSTTGSSGASDASGGGSTGGAGSGTSGGGSPTSPPTSPDPKPDTDDDLDQPEELRRLQAAGMIPLPGSRAQPMGIDVADLDAHVDVVGKLGVVEGAYERALLIATPAHTVPLDPFLLSKYELTNDQWRLFLISTEQSISMPAGENLARLAAHLWKLEGDTQGKALQQGWMYLMERNWDVLQPILNPADAADWDPLIAKAGETEIPEGTLLWYSLYMPPPQLKGDPKKRLVVAEGQEKFPVRYVSWEAAMDFCRWAGLHVPRERELEHAMRGEGGRLYAWGDEWQPWRAVWRGYNDALKPITPRGEPLTDEQEAYNAAMTAATAGGEYVAAPGGRNITGPLPVDTLPPTGAGFHHLQGNVSEWALEPAKPCPGSECSFKYWNTSRVARGGSYDEHAAYFHAADRTTQGTYAYLPPTAAESNRGLRPAAYPQPGRDLTVALMEPFHSWQLTRGAHQWLPIPPGLSAKDSRPTARIMQEPFMGFDDAITSGWIERQVKAESEDHVFITGAATGIAVLPAKGFAAPVVRDVRALRRVADDPDRALLVGVLTGTDRLGVRLSDGKTVRFDDERARSETPELARRSLPLGYFLVLEGERVAVYEPDPRRHGSPQAHLTSREPLGYLPTPWKAERRSLRSAAPSAERDRDRTRLRFPLRELDRRGTPVTDGGAQAIVVEIEVETARR